MKIAPAIGIFAAMAAISILSSGCGSSSSIPSFGSKNASSPYFQIQTVTTNPKEAWGNVSIAGYANSNSMAQACDPTADSNCIGEVGGPFLYAVPQNAISSFKTNSNGRANFFTDAQPAIWYFYANGPSNKDCSSTSASYTTYQDEPDGSFVPIECGSNPASMVSSPDSCWTTITSGLGGGVTSNCPASVTLSFPPGTAATHQLPLSTALTATSYDSSGNNLAQSSITAASATAVSVPTPATVGTTYLVVQDSSGTVLGAAEFTYTFTRITPPPHCNPNTGCSD